MRGLTVFSCVILCASLIFVSLSFSAPFAAALRDEARTPSAAVSLTVAEPAAELAQSEAEPLPPVLSQSVDVPPASEPTQALSGSVIFVEPDAEPKSVSVRPAARYAAAPALPESGPNEPLAVFTKSVDMETRTAGLTLRIRNDAEKAVNAVIYSVLTLADGTVDSCDQTALSLAAGEGLYPIAHRFHAPQGEGTLTIYCWNTSLQPLTDPVTEPITLRQTVTALILNQTDASLVLTRKDSVSLSYWCLPQSASKPFVTFESSNPAVAAVSGTGLVTPVGKGTADIFVITQDRTAYAVCHVTVISDVTRLTLDADARTLKLISGANTHQLNAVVTPDDAPDRTVTFTSDHPEIATVSQTGLITALHAGTAVITAATGDGAATATCTVTAVSVITGVTLNATSVTLKPVSGEDTYQLTVAVIPAGALDRTVTYSSNHPEIASVSQTGLITAKRAGTAVITAAAENGGFTAACTVTVAKAATSIKLNQAAINMWDYGTYTLKATVTGGDGNGKVTWRSSDDSIATVSAGGIVYGVAKGSAVITASVDGKKATCKVNVYREYDYMGTVAARFESGDDPGLIAGSDGGKSYGCLMFYAGVDTPKSFFNWLISSDFNPVIGKKLKKAFEADGNAYGKKFDQAWKDLAASEREEFRSCQMAFGMGLFYEPLVNRLVSELGFFPDNYGLALKSALWSRSIQHGVSGAFNRIKTAFETIGGFQGKSEKALITAIYNESGAVVSKPPGSGATPMNSSSSIAVENGLVGKYMKYFSNNSSSVQAGVWYRLHVTERNLLYDMLDHPPVVITK